MRKNEIKLYIYLFFVLFLIIELFYFRTAETFLTVKIYNFTYSFITRVMSNERSDYEDAQQVNTIDSNKEFLANHTDGEHEQKVSEKANSNDKSDKQTLQQEFAKVKIIRLIMEDSLKLVHLPWEDDVREALEAVGFTVVSKGATNYDATVRMKVGGVALSMTYWKSPLEKLERETLYTGAKLTGKIIFYVGGKQIASCACNGLEHTPGTLYGEGEDYTEPRDAPFTEAYKDIKLEQKLFSALLDIGGVYMVERYIRALSVTISDIRCSAAHALGEIGDRRAVEPLIEVLRDSDWSSRDARESAAYALGKIGDKRAVEPLINELDDSDLDTRRAAAQALSQISTPRATFYSNLFKGEIDEIVIKGESQVEPLIEALGSGLVVSRSAAKALGEIGDARAVEPLIKSLTRTDFRFTAIQALGKIGKSAVKPLIKRLDDSGWFVRYTAAQALGEIGDSQAVEPLIKTLDDSDESVRLVAAQALGEIGDSRAIEPLIEKIGDPEELVRRASVEALKEITGEDFGIDKGKWQAWFEENNKKGK